MVAQDVPPQPSDEGVLLTVAAGERLVNQRKKGKHTLEEAAAALHIAASQLQALEAGDFSVFRAEVYARGAYVAYAGWLGLDERESQHIVSRALAQGRVVVPLKMHTPAKWWQRIVSPRSVIVVAATSLALIVGGYVAWQLRSFWQLPALEVTSPDTGYISDDVITVRGVSEPEARIRINGEAVLLQENATFEVRLSTHPGINVIQVEAENAAGRIHVVERHILRPRYGG